MATATMPADVQIATALTVPDPALISAWAEAALAGAVPVGRSRGRPATEGDLCVRVVDAAESQELNTRYRDRSAPTNVLSFPAEVDLPEALIWGDVVVCAPVVLAEAQSQGKTFDGHFAHMVVHGVLHLLGYDHESASEAERMESLERQILDRFGVSDPYREG